MDGEEGVVNVTTGERDADGSGSVSLVDDASTRSFSFVVCVAVGDGDAGNAGGADMEGCEVTDTLSSVILSSLTLTMTGAVRGESGGVYMESDDEEGGAPVEW